MFASFRSAFCIRLAALVLLAVFLLPVGALAAQFTIDESGVITAYSGTETELVIPDTVDGITVTGIGNSAFQGNTSLTSIVIPEGVTSIGMYAFQNCSSLESIAIPNGVASLSRYTFSGCSSLICVTVPGCAIKGNSTAGSSGTFRFYFGTNVKEVIIADGVNNIGDYAFEGCSALESVIIPSSVTNIEWWSPFWNCNSLKTVYIPSLEDWLEITFEGSSSNPMVYAEELYIGGELLTDVIIPDGTTAIGNYMFYGCESLEHISIPESVTTIGAEAFSGCSGLMQVNIPSGITSIGEYMFYGCESLAAVEIPDGVTEIGDCAFYRCKSLTNIVIPEGVTSIGEHAFHTCSSLESINIPAGVESIAAWTFTDCSSLKAVYTPSLTEWLEIEFGGTCANPVEYAQGLYVGGELLTQAVIPDGITVIGQYAFYGYEGLESVSLPSELVSIGEYAFEYCSGINAVYVPSAESWLEMELLSNPMMYAKELYVNGQPLTHVTIPEDWTEIDHYRFTNCRSLESVDIPSGVTQIGQGAFKGCSSLEGVIIPDSVTSINDYAFEDCSSLAYVEIPESVASIGYYAFSGCASLAEIEIQNSALNAGRGAFSDCGSLIRATIPACMVADSGSTYRGTFYDYFGSNEASPRVKEVIIADGVTRIGQYAFYGCSTIENVSIPDSVTSIGVNAFKNCTGIENMDIPAGVTSIASGAFDGCTNLVHITVPACAVGGGANSYAGGTISGIFGKTVKEVVVADGATNIGQSAFSDCYQLECVSIPDSVTSIGNSAFEGCTSLVNVIIPEAVTSIGSHAFEGCTSLKNIIIPEAVTSIGNSVFEGCTNLVDVEMPKNMSSIGKSAFYGCSSLLSIVIPEGITSIGWSTFRECSSLESVCIPAGLTEMGDLAFADCNGLKEVQIPSIEDWLGLQFVRLMSNPMCYASRLYIGEELIKHVSIPEGSVTIDAYRFYNCSSLETVEMPESVLTIGSSAFYNCTALSCVSMSVNITSIGSSVFSGCSSLTEIEIPSGVTSIGQNTFYECSGLTSIEIPEGVTSIENNAFEGCSGLESVTIPSSLMSIGHAAFYECSGLNEVYIPTIEDWMEMEFAYSWGNPMYYAKELYVGGQPLTHVTIPEGSTKIDANRFRQCSSLESVSISESVTSIGDWAFYGCSSLTEVEIPTGVISIGSSAFGDCGSLARVTIPGCVIPGGEYNKKAGTFAYSFDTGVKEVIIADGVTSIGAYAFKGCSGMEKVDIPATVTSIGQAAFQGCTALKQVVIPEGETELGYYTFSGCSSLESVSMPSTVTSIGQDAFYGCQTLDAVYIPTVADWLEISFYNYYSNPLYYANNLYADEKLVRHVTIQEGIDAINSYAFYNCKSLESIDIPASLETIGTNAFSGCSSLKHIMITGEEAPAFTIPNISGFTVYCYEYSETDFWAIEKGYNVSYLDGKDLNVPITFRLVLDTSLLTGMESVEITPVMFPAQENPTIQWISSAPEVASVENGVVTAVSSGEATITAVCGGVSASVDIRVYIEAESFGFSVQEAYMISKETMRIAIENIYPAGAEVSFSAICEDEGIAEIGTATENGTHYIDITAKRAGDTEITVTETIAGAQSVCPVHVYYPVTAIEFEKESTDVALGMAARITANVTARDRSVVNKLVTFSSGNDAVASVDANGTVTGHAEGTVVITAAAASGVSAQCMVVVRDAGTMRSMVLPSAVKCIEDEAFENSAAEIVILPDGCTQIGARAFAENSRLTSVYMPDSVTVIAGDAFESCAAVTFVCESENDAAAYAADHGIPYSIP